MSNKKKIIIFGLGSSALRFAELLLDKYEVYFYAHRLGLKAPEYAQLSQRDPFPEGKPRLGTQLLNYLIAKLLQPKLLISAQLISYLVTSILSNSFT